MKPALAHLYIPVAVSVLEKRCERESQSSCCGNLTPSLRSHRSDEFHPGFEGR